MIKPIDKIYARKLRALRLKKDIKQQVMSELLFLSSQQQYSKLELGEKRFSKEIVKSICTYFEIKEVDFASDISEGEIAKQAPAEDLESIKTVLSLKSQINEFQVILNLMYSKLLLEKEIELINTKIKNYTEEHYLYRDGNGRYVLLQII